ncbi:MAG: Flp family type IVb pilin [Candidatus Hydrogenedentes bacterium]|nr:Flp family type IVb pilin [Candidatus Hydrogenedentota bacterium]
MEVVKMTMLKKFLKDEEGLELVEYAVMTALIVAVLTVAIGALSGAISDRMGEVERVNEGSAT